MIEAITLTVTSLPKPPAMIGMVLIQPWKHELELSITRRILAVAAPRARPQLSQRSSSQLSLKRKALFGKTHMSVPAEGGGMKKTPNTQPRKASPRGERPTSNVQFRSQPPPLRLWRAKEDNRSHLRQS